MKPAVIIFMAACLIILFVHGRVMAKLTRVEKCHARLDELLKQKFALLGKTSLYLGTDNMAEALEADSAASEALGDSSSELGELTALDEKLVQAKQSYCTAVTQYNDSIKKPPGSIIAAVFQYQAWKDEY